MSYSSRVYRHRNAHTPENENDNEQSSAFFKKGDQKSGEGKAAKPFFQAKLNVNKPGDEFEKEADNVANKVANKNTGKPAVKEEEVTNVQKLASSPAEEKISTDEERMKRDKDIQTKPEIQRKCDECAEEEKEEKKGPAVQKKELPGVEKEKDKDADKKKEELEKDVAVQKKESSASTSNASDGGGANTTGPKLSSRIQNSAGKGKKMPGKTLSEMQSGFGADFHNVNIHTDAEAVDMNKRLDAQAFTHGNDIYFNSGKFNPESSAGKLLLAHELTHVLQQRGAEGIESEGTGVQKVGAPQIVVAAVLAAATCAVPFYLYALSNYAHKGDKWMHCWVSCKLTAYCGGFALSTLVGASKEALDAACDLLGMGFGAEFADFVADLKGTFNCAFHTCAGCCDEYIQKHNVCTK